MKVIGAQFQHVAAAIADLQASLQSRPGEEMAMMFVSRRREPRPAALAPRDPAMPGTPPDGSSDRAEWIARQLQADCFHFARPDTVPRRG